MHLGPARATSRYVDREVVQRILKFADFVAVFVAASLALIAAAMPPVAERAAISIGFLAAEISLLCVFILRSAGLYDVSALTGGLWTSMRAGLATFLAGAIMFGAADLLLLPLDFSWASSWAAFSAGYFLLTRQTLSLWASPISRSGRFRKQVAIVGGGKAAEDALKTLETSSDIDIEVVGLFDDREDQRSPASVMKHRKLGKITDLADFAREHRVDLIIVAIPLSAEARLLHILRRLWELPIDIRISGQASALKLGPRAYTYLGKLPLLAVFDRPLNGWNSFMKSTVDRVIAALAIAVLAPVMLGVALAVRLESNGPVIFRQRRYGFNNELIEVFKFRSMYTDLTDVNAAKLVTRGDPRVTKVGRIIRKTSLDELPQLFNVLTGQLSLVGPRPHATQAKAADALYEKVVDGYFARHKVKPGITGWAQINGWRGETDTHEKIEQRVKHDLEYIDQWSLGLDLLILAKTPFALLKSENAY
jgi:Undecaprenyl-phosphate glucose phosphotransferase